MAALGALVGPLGVAVTMAVAVVTASLVGLLLMVLKGGREIPFGPYLAVGWLVACIWGAPLVQALFLGVSWRKYALLMA